MHDYEVVVNDTTAQLPPGEQVAAGSAVALRWRRQPEHVPPAHERRPAGRQGRGPRLGPEGQEGRQRQRQQPARRRRSRACSAAQVANDLGGGTTASPTASPPTTPRPTRSPSPRCSGWPTPSSRPTASPSATRRSRPAARSRSRASARSSAATFTVTSSTHSYRGATRLPDAASRSPAARRARSLELIRPPEKRDWSASLVVGVVTNNNDPEQRGRVRVKYPSLSDSGGVGVGAGRDARAPATRAAC